MTDSSGAVAAVVLAAGEGKRLKSPLPKVLHEVAGLPLLGHALRAVAGAGIDDVTVVASARRGEFEDSLARAGLLDGSKIVVQDPPRGTGDAVRVAMEAVGGGVPLTLVTLGDAPLITSETLRLLLEEQRQSDAAAVVLTAHADRSSDAGRVLREPDGTVARIVEVRDATEEELEVTEVNAGFYVFKTDLLRSALERLKPDNAQGEYYLTDVIEALVPDGVAAVAAADPDDTLGVNDQAQLAQASNVLRTRVVNRWLEGAVKIIDPASTFIDVTVELEPGCTIKPFTFLEGKTRVAAGAEIGPQVRLVDSEVEEGAEVSFAVVKGSSVGPDAQVGPFASLRPGTRLERGARLGTFVESKKTVLGENSKANHLAYLGDAEVGSGVNIGAGTITCNWDGRDKHATKIDDDAYIGSDTMLVAPVHIGERAATGAGAVVRGEVPPDSLAVGVPARVIEGKGNRMDRGEPTDDASGE